MSTPRDIVFRVGVGEVYAMVVAEGSSWSPDVARDMVSRLAEVWDNTIESAVEVGLIDTSRSYDDEEDGDGDFEKSLAEDIHRLFADDDEEV